MAYCLGRGVWSGAELAEVLPLATLLNGPMVHWFPRECWLAARHRSGNPRLLHRSIGIHLYRLGTATLSKAAGAMAENCAGGNEDAIFLFVRNDVIEVIYGDDGPVIFMYKMKCILYMIALKSINDPIN